MRSGKQNNPFLCMSLAVFVAVVVFTASASEGSTAAKDFGFNLQITVSLVQVTATVYDSWGRTVYGLTADDFEVYENGKKKKKDATIYPLLEIIFFLSA